ncbi:uncharacterized protein LOC106087086 [Stomoxys calcitrans]|nr:uncharacterized protein LOC106087086 [Stomoxys calcitrans]
MSVELIHEDGRNKLNGSFSFAQDFNDLHIFNWVILNRPNGKRPTLYNVSVSACKFLDNSAKNLNPIFATVLQLLKKYITGFPRKCPLQKNLEHLMKGIYFDEDMMPPYLPENNFTGVIGFMRANIMGFKVTLKARVESKFKGDNRRGKK